MISLDDLRQINDMAMILSNTRRKLSGTKPVSYSLSETLTQIQTPEKTITKAEINPDRDKDKKTGIPGKCRYCGKTLPEGQHFCDNGHASLYRTFGPRKGVL